MVDHSFSIEMRKLNGECFECMAFRHIIFDRRLEFFICESLPTDSFKLIIRESGLKQVTHLVIPIRGQIATVIFSNSRNFISENFLKCLLLLGNIHLHGRHQISHIRRWLQTSNVLFAHWFPQIIISQIPARINYLIVTLNISIE